MIILGEPNNPWICMVEDHVDADTFIRLLSDAGYTIRPGQKFTHEYWIHDEDGWRKSSKHRANSRPVTVVRW